MRQIQIIKQKINERAEKRYELPKNDVEFYIRVVDYTDGVFGLKSNTQYVDEYGKVVDEESWNERLYFKTQKDAEKWAKTNIKNKEKNGKECVSSFVL